MAWAHSLSGLVAEPFLGQDLTELLPHLLRSHAPE